MTTELEISGMSCSGCVANVEDALESVEWVDDATVSLDEERAAVTGDATPAALVSAVEDAGYEAKVCATEP